MATIPSFCVAALRLLGCTWMDGEVCSPTKNERTQPGAGHLYRAGGPFVPSSCRGGPFVRIFCPSGGHRFLWDQGAGLFVRFSLYPQSVGRAICTDQLFKVLLPLTRQFCFPSTSSPNQAEASGNLPSGKTTFAFRLRETPNF